MTKEANFICLCECDGTKEKEKEKRQAAGRMAELGKHGAGMTSAEMAFPPWGSEVSVLLAARPLHAG